MSLFNKLKFVGLLLLPMPTSIRETLDLYEKHGWVLRRLMLTERTGTEFAGKTLIANQMVEYIRSDIDLAWFSRPPGDGPIAWELRHLGSPPFALVESLDESDPDFEERLASVETRLRDNITGNRSHPPDGSLPM